MSVNEEDKEKENYSTYNTLKTVCEEVKQSWNKDKTNEMEKIIDILKEINSKQSLEEYFVNNEEALKYFLNEFIGTVINSILSKPHIKGKNGDDIALELLFQIYKLFSNFHQNKKYHHIFQCIRNLFENNMNFSYFYPLNKLNKQENSINKKNYQYKDFNKEFCTDFLKNETPEINFTEGDRVDILVPHYESKYFIDKTAWVRGIIKKIENGLYFIEYNGEENEITIPLGSQKVQKEGTKTGDWEWRTNLKKYDLIDVFYKDQWWPASIIEIEEIKENEGIKRVKYRIGFRLYLDHFKNEDDPADCLDNYLSFWEDTKINIDENKQEFRGFHPEKDEIILHYSKRIQKFNSFSEIEKQIKETGQTQIISILNNDLANEDIQENEIIDNNFFYIKNNKKNIIIGKPGNFSYYFALLLKKIESIGDFEKYINILLNEPNYEETLTIFTIIISSLNYIHIQYIEENKEILKTAFCNFINSLNDEDYKNLNKNLIESITNILSKVLQNDNNFEENKIEKEEDIILNIAIKKIKTTFFDKRLQGIKYLNEYINKNINNINKLLKICELLKNNNIIEEIFGPNYHSQMIYKSFEIVKILIGNKLLDDRDVNLIWGCTQKGDLEVKKAIISLLLRLIYNYDESFIGILLNAIINNSDVKSNEKESEFVLRLSFKVQSQENNLKICQYFCKNILEMDNFSETNPIYEKLLKLMKHDENYIIQVLKICEQKIKENKYTLLCYSLIASLINNFVIINNTKEPPYSSEKNSLIDFLKDKHLLMIFENNFSYYMENSKKINESQKYSSGDELIIDGFTHKENINGRLNCLNILTMIYPNYYFYPQLKDLLFENPVFQEDKTYFYEFIQSYCFPSNDNYVNETKNKTKEELFNIFTENDQTLMTYKEFKLFILSFFYLNSNKFFFRIINKNNDEEYIIKLKPNAEKEENKEIDQLWRIIFEVKDEKIINKLINIIYEIEPNKQVIISNISSTADGEEDFEKIEKCYNLLEMFFIESEKKNLIDIKSHYSLLRNSIIKFPLKINEKRNNSKVIQLFYDNTSLNDIKEELMKKYNIPIEYIEAYLKNGNQEILLDYKYNNKSLKEIILDDKNIKEQNKKLNDILIFKIKKMEMEDLIINKDFTPTFKNILKEQFKQITKGTGKMDNKSITEFFSKITNNYSTESKEKIEKSFKRYDEDNTGFINEEAFYKIYLDSILENGENIDNLIKNLDKMGYNQYLRKKDESLEYKHIENSELFRVILSKEEFMNAFIDYYNKFPQLNYNFLFFFPTKKEIYEEILDKFNKDLEAFNTIFKEDSNVLKQLYYLIIFESFLQDIELSSINPENIFKNFENKELVISSRKYEPFESYDIVKKKKFWIDFIKSKLFEELIKYNYDILNKYKRKKNEVLKKCCKKGLKIMKIIFEACFDINPKSDPIEGDIYYLDFRHIKDVLKDEDEAKNDVLNISYSSLFKRLQNYLSDNINNIDDLYNDCFEILIMLLALKEDLLYEILHEEKSKESFYNLIKEGLFSNSNFITKCLTDNLKKIFSIPNSSNNKFIELIYDLMESIIYFISNNENKSIILYNEFLEFFSQIYDCISNMGRDSNNKLILRIIEILINNINEKNKEKKISNVVFIKCMELITKLIEKNSNLKEEIATYKIKGESLASTILEKIILCNFNYKGNEDNEKNIENKNDEDKFVFIDENEEENIEQKEELNKICINFIIQCLKDLDDSNAIKEKLRLNQILKKSLEIEEGNTDIVLYNNSNNKKYAHSKESKVCGHVGLYNLGSICYMNSILQQLFMVSAFRFAIMGCDDNMNPESSSIEKFGVEDDNLFHQLQVMFTFLTLSEKKDFNPKYFCKSFKDSDGKPINVKIQQDSQEFYNNFIDKIENGLKNTKYKYIIKDVFTGKTCSSLFCGSCQHVSYNFENLNNLTLEVNNINNLNDSLKKFILPEFVDNFKCEGCKQLVTIKKTTTLYQLPNILVIYLKRFSMNYENNMAEKTNSKFDFPDKINLKKFCIEMSKKEEIINSDDIYFKNEEYYEYVLKGVNIHSGDASGGHYISLIDIKREGNGNIMKTFKGNENSKWLKFNDSNLSQFDPKNIPSQCFGGQYVENSQCAYLLIYEKIKKTPIKIIIDKKNIFEEEDKNIINFSKNEEKEINIKYDISKINNIKEEELYKLIFHNEENNEYYKYIPYYSIPKCVPKEIYNKVIQDNMSVTKNEKNLSNKNIINTEEQNKLKDLLYSAISSQNFIKEIKSYNNNEQIDIVNLVLFDIFQKIKKKNLTEEEKKEINNTTNLIINNLIEPLISDKIDANFLDDIQKCFITKENIEIIFSKDNPIFKEESMDLIQKIIIKILKELKEINEIALTKIFEMIAKYLKKLKQSNLFDGKEKSDPIKYIYKIVKECLQLKKDFSEICIKENLVYLLFNGIERQTPSNQDNILFILNVIIKGSEDYNKKLYYQKEENINSDKPEIKYKSRIRKIFYNNDVLELLYEKEKELLFKLLQILEYNDKNFSKNFNLNNLPFLLEKSIKKKELVLFIKLCYNLIDIKDDYCIERMKQILGFPTMIIRPIKGQKNNEQERNDNKKWPLFGSELIKNEKNIKAEIFKYICFYNKNKLCVLSYLLPCSCEIYINKENELLDDNIIKEMAKQLISKCLLDGGNYCLFKYLYLLPARNLQYQNAYEELVNINSGDSPLKDHNIKNNEKHFIDKINYELNDIYKKRNLKDKTIKEIEKPELPKELDECNPDIKAVTEFIGFKPDFIPGDIVKEEFQSIVKSKFLQLIRVEYYTKYFKIDEIKNIINEKKSIKGNDYQLNNKETFDEKEKIIKVDISNPGYQINENELIMKISKKLEKAKKLIIEDESNPDKINSIKTFIRYIFINKKPINNKIEAHFSYKNKLSEKIKANSNIPDFLINYVDRHNYVDILDIYRINRDENLIEKDDILIQINSKAYLDN